MNRRGFTLVELLAVIVVLSALSLIVVSSINSTLERREEREIVEQQQLAINAAKIYFSLESGDCVKIDDLIGKYLSSDKIKRLDKNYSIAIVNEGGSQVYKYQQQNCP